MKYAWIIDTDHIMRKAQGVTGPHGAPAALIAKLEAGEGHIWRTLDGDDAISYSGRLTVEDESRLGGDELFGPLDDFCNPDSGDVTIQYKINGNWVTL